MNQPMFFGNLPGTKLQTLQPLFRIFSKNTGSENHATFQVQLSIGFSNPKHPPLLAFDTIGTLCRRICNATSRSISNPYMYRIYGSIRNVCKLLLAMMSLEIYTYCANVNRDYVNDTKYEYMYTYKYPTEEVPEGGYEAYAKTLKKKIYGYNFDITVMGLTENNPFFDVNLSD